MTADQSDIQFSLLPQVLIQFQLKNIKYFIWAIFSSIGQQTIETE